jgi:hypothetical protein
VAAQRDERGTAAGWCSLFDGLPEAAARDRAVAGTRRPVRSRCSGIGWGVLQATDGQAQLLALRSHWPFEVWPPLAVAWRHAWVALPGCCATTTAVPTAVQPCAAPRQQQHWLRPAVFWSWLDRDGQGQRLARTDDAYPAPWNASNPLS